MRERKGLPHGWAWTDLGGVGTYLNGRAFKKEEWSKQGRPIIRIQDLTGTGTAPNYFEGEVEPRYEVSHGDLLVSWAATLGAYIWRGPVAVLNQHIFKVESHLDPHFHFYLLQTILAELQQQAHGTGMVHITKGKFDATPVPIPPLNEQGRIVAEIEIHLTRLEAAVASLQRVQANLRRYRAAVLKAACEGRLVPTEAELARVEGQEYETGGQLLAKTLEQRRRQWEEQYLAKAEITGKRLRDDWKSSYREPSTLANDLPNLPEGWVWAPIDCLATKVVDGVHKKPDYVDNGIPFVTVRNLTAGPGISLKRLNFVSRADHEEFIRRAHPEQGDLLVSKDGTLGVVRAIRTAVEFSIFVSVALIKPVLREMTDYLEIALMSPQVQAQMVPKGSGLSHIHLEDLRRDCVPLPPITEQRRIVDEVQRHLSMIEAAEVLVSANLSRATSLRQAILKQAFAGRLVPQDPNDEPASVLLERIRQARVLQPAEPRARKARTKPLPAPPPSPPPPASAEEPTPLFEPEPQEANFLQLPRDEQVAIAWESLFGQGMLDKDVAIRTVADELRSLGLARFKRLRQDGPLYGAIVAAIEKGVREGSFDRPRRGCVRAVLPDPKEYEIEDWQRCLLAVTGPEPADIDATLRAAAEWAREAMGLEYARLREDGVILMGLREALDEAVRTGEFVRRGGRVRRG